MYLQLNVCNRALNYKFYLNSGPFGIGKITEKCQKTAFFDLVRKKIAKKFASSKNGSNFATLLKGDIV